MSKEPRQQQQQQQIPTSSSGRPYITAQNFHLITSRVKPLPPSADLSKLPNNGQSTTLFQFKQSVEFRCAHCKRDKIQDDAFALDGQSGRITCQRCFARLIRPRSYKPTRLVPFPSLLSWLNFSGGNADNTFTRTGTDGANNNNSNSSVRMAEAVIPSEARARNISGTTGDSNVAGLISATPMIGLQQNAAETLATMRNQYGQQQNDTSNIIVSQQQSQQQQQPPPQTHPCASVFNQNSCSHGATCFFSKAPGNLCLCYLMGLCPSTSLQSCPFGRIHQKVFDLPTSSGSDQQQQQRPERWQIITTKKKNQQQSNNNNEDSADNEEEEEENVAVETDAFKNWVSQKKESKNQPEWQLWNQENVSNLLDKMLPAPKVEQPQKQKKPVNVGSLNASAIESLLKSMKK